MSVATALACVGGAALLAYDGLGILFLMRDRDVVHSCHASNSRVHAIWPTSLWVYVLFSLVFATLFTGVLMAVPLKRSIDAARKHLNRHHNGMHKPDPRSAFNAPALKFGLLSTLPDWLFLWVGSALIMASMALMILAFWGYFELFMARPWCDDKKTAFEELDLWHFGRVTFFLQIVAGAILFLWGLLYWSAPFFLELTTPSSPSPRLLDREP